MLHIISENKELKNRVFPMPDNVRKYLTKTLEGYKGDKTVDGYKRLNNLLAMDGVSYHEMKRLKNFFDNYKGTPKSAEYILNGGDPIKTWVNNTLNTATKAVHDFKQAKKDAGVSNAFIKHHDKNRQSKKKNKPTQVKFATNNVNSKMLSGDMMKYESVDRKRTIVITERQEKMLSEAADDKFSYEELSNIPTFKGRFQYCTQHLGAHVGKGSSRAVFQIDDHKILKLACNEKGIAQNWEEYRAYGDDIFPQVYDKDYDDKWILAEYVLPAKKKDFDVCLGIDFETFCQFIGSCAVYRFGAKAWHRMPEEQWMELLESNEELQAFDEYIGNYGKIVVGDMVRLANYGMTVRDGKPKIVLLDAGLTDYVWNTYYKRG